MKVFLSALQVPPAAAMLAVRADPAVERVVAAVDKEQGLTKVRDMLQVASDRLAPKRLTAELIASFAGLPLVCCGDGGGGVSAGTARRACESDGCVAA